MKIVFIVGFQFPYGSASSMRARNLYKLLEMAGHNVHIISDYDTDSDTDDCREFSYEPIFDKNTSFFRRQIVPYKSIVVLKKYCQKHKVDCIVMNALYDRFEKVRRFCKKTNIKLIVENCEWYDESSFKLGKFDPRYYQNQRMINCSFKRADGFISISRFLDVHNRSLKKKSVRIPTIIDVQSTPCKYLNENRKIKIVYTGRPGRSKEFLLPVIKVLAENWKFQEKIEFHIYGPSYSEVLKNIGNDTEVLKKAGSSVVIHERVPQNEMQSVLMNADYLIFLRPDRRSSNAGFPTKLGESFAVGTPVIANDTGDLSLYIKSGENGYLLNSCDNEELRDLFEELIKMDDEKYCKIRKGARKTAEENFDYRKYINEINEVL